MAFTKEEWKSILSVPTCCLRDDVYKRVEKHKSVIKGWIDGGIVEINKTGDVWEELGESKNHLCFTSIENYRIQPDVELSLALSKKQAHQLVWVLENSSFDSADSRKVRNILIKNLNDNLEAKERK